MNSDNIEHLKNFQRKFQSGSLQSLVQDLPNDYLNKDNLLTKKALDIKVQKINSCNEKLYKEKSVICDKETGEIIDEKTTFLYGNYCNEFLLCPICAKKRSNVIKAKYVNKMKELSKTYKFKYMITFTIQNNEYFSKAWDILQKSIRDFRRNAQKRKRFNSTTGKYELIQKREAYKIKAGLGCGEAKIGKGSNMWHLHFHFIVFSDEMIDYTIYDPKIKSKITDEIKLKYNRLPRTDELRPAVKDIALINNKEVPMSALSREWYKSTGCRGINIDCRPIDTINTETINEIIKYASKINEISVDKQLEMLMNKNGKRFLVTWGELRGIKKEDEEIEIEETMLKYDYIESHVYDYKENKLKNMPDDYLALIEAIAEKKDQLKEFRILANKTLQHKKQIFSAIKSEIFIKSLNCPAYKQKKINEINSISKAFKTYLDNLFFNTVKIDRLKCKKSKVKMLTTIEKQYYERFDDFVVQHQKLNLNIPDK